MATIAVLHPTFQTGGAESVCFNIIDRLQESHQVDLFTLEQPNVEMLNEQFRTSVDRSQMEIFTPNYLYRTFAVCNAVGNRIAGGFFNSNIPLQLALISRRFTRSVDQYDLRISTYGELALQTPSIQYVHHPLLNRLRAGGEFGIEVGMYGYYNELMTRLAGSSPQAVKESSLLTNSEWTADQIEQIYSTRPTVVSPPVDASGFDASRVPWREREDGILTIGRVAPDKQTERAINVVKKVRGQGHDVHLHLVGPLGSNTPYNERIRVRLADLEWASLEEKVSRNKLVRMVESHKWGFHPKPKEHFGIAVAELVSGGAVPLVPDSGGCKEIVQKKAALCYGSTPDAVKKLSRLLDTPKLGKSLSIKLRTKGTAFGRERFYESIESIVSQHLDNMIS